MTMSSTNSMGQLDNHMKNKEICSLPQATYKIWNQLDCKAKCKRQNNKAFSVGYS